MFFMCELLCLLFLFCQVTEADNMFSSYFVNLKLVLNSSRVWISKAYSKVEASVPAFGSFLSLYNKKLNLTSVAGKIITNVNKGFHIFINSSDNFITHLTNNSSFWHLWPFKGFQSNRCSLHNVTNSDYLIKQELYGQHLVRWSVNKFLKTHLNNEHPSKPLVMSFQGPTGCGKSFASKIIADTLYQDGLNSKYVHIYHGSTDFPQESKKVMYQKRLLNEIFMFTSVCEKSLFIFDEMEKMIPGVIDVLIPYLTFEAKCSTIDFTKSTFIFLSNTGSSIIEEITYDAWLKGVNREDMIIEEFSSQLKDAAYYSTNGLQYSEFVDKNLIDVFVPFLPLEKKHVKQCIVAELKLRKLPHEEEIVEKVANQLVYNPPEFSLFSVSGCKRVSHKVDLYGGNDV